eukprot:3277254-Amphidinium_carterae.1
MIALAIASAVNPVSPRNTPKPQRLLNGTKWIFLDQCSLRDTCASTRKGGPCIVFFAFLRCPPGVVVRPGLCASPFCMRSWRMCVETGSEHHTFPAGQVTALSFLRLSLIDPKLEKEKQSA